MSQCETENSSLQFVAILVQQPHRLMPGGVVASSLMPTPVDKIKWGEQSLDPRTSSEQSPRSSEVARELQEPQDRPSKLLTPSGKEDTHFLATEALYIYSIEIVVSLASKSQLKVLLPGQGQATSDRAWVAEAATGRLARAWGNTPFAPRVHNLLGHSRQASAAVPHSVRT